MLPQGGRAGGCRCPPRQLIGVTEFYVADAPWSHLFGMAETFRPDLSSSGRDEKFSATAQMPKTYLSCWAVATGQMRINFCHGDAEFQKLFCFLFDRAVPL